MHKCVLYYSEIILYSIYSNSIKMHLTSVTEFYTNLRQYHIVGSVNAYPTMFILMVIQIPCSLINSQASDELRKEKIKTLIIFIMTL